MSKDVYRKLQEHLDAIGVGFPKTESGVEIAILKRIFEPEEAETAPKLTMLRETAEAFAQRVGLSKDEAQDRLEQMARKGQIFRIRNENQTTYCASPFVPGIYEYQLNNLDRDLAQLMEKYFGESQGRLLSGKNIPLFRTLPVERNISTVREVMPYDRVKEIIRSQSTIVLTDCICRKERRLAGHECNHVDDVCMVFSHMARYYVENGLGRLVSVEEALDALDRAEKDGLVHAPFNAQRPMGFCNCCGCCCGVLRGITEWKLAPSKVIRSDFYCQSDPESCTGCGVCTERCMFGAVELVNGAARIDRAKCIGCGLCVSTCPGDALRMVRKSDDEIPELLGSVSEVLLSS